MRQVVVFLFVSVCVVAGQSSEAAILRVCASGCAYSNLQPAIDAAQPGDTILLRAGETFAGPFVLRNKPGSNAWIEIRSDASDSVLPATGVRLVPSGKPGANTSRSLLPRLIGRGNNYRTTPVVHTEAGARYYILRFLEIDGSESLGWDTVMSLGDYTSATPPSDIVVDRVYVHGHFTKGQKRGIALNSGRAEILNSYISDIRAVGFDSQALGGWNGAGPYRIINNYLEAAGENIMFGGEDPAFYGLIPSNIEISRNHIYKPTSWAGPILAPPTSPRAVDSGTGGGLGAGTHYFKVVALFDTGPVTANSLASSEVAVTLPGSRTATISWSAVSGAERYRIYRGWGPNAQSVYMETTSSATTFQYSGFGEQYGTVSTSASEWAIKNLIELKNAQNVVIDGNVIENVWAAAQNGYAIVLTPRNQYGRTPWVVVRDVAFTNNIIRSAASVLTLMGRDDNYASQQTQRVTFRNNLIYNIDPRGSYAKTFVIGYSPSTVTIDRNTIIHANSSVLFPHSGQIQGFTFTNNATLHNQYGIMGDGGRTGSYSIDMYFPGGVVTNNVLAGGNASLYPVPNAFPTLAQWNASFVDLANHDYRILSSSVFYSAGAGGSVPGADLGKLYDATKPSGSAGTPTSPPPTSEPPPSSNTAPVARPGGPYATTAGTSFQVTGTASSDGEGAIASYLWQFGDEMVIHASDVPASAITGSAWARTSLSGAANGVAILNTDRGAAKLSTPLASPASYVDVRFYAARGVPYRIWVRSRATNDSWANDSMFMQFSGRVDGQGNAVDRIGTTQGSVIFLEDSNGGGVSGWGWNDEVYGTASSVVYFATTGLQTLRLQQREDGIAWDQIVISAARYRSAAPGPLKNDSTIVPRTLGTSASAVSTYEYAVAGVYPLVLTVVDGGGLAATASTTVTVSASGTTPGDGGGSGGLSVNHGGPYSGTVGSALNFDGTRSTASTSAQYFWSFGDDVVLGASNFSVVGTRWRTVADATAANGSTLENPDLGEAKVSAPSAAPASYVEATFRAAAGVPYRIWIRMRASNDGWTNDSAFVQFSGSVTSSGAATNRIGSTQGMVMFLEDGSGAGLSGWGWGDNGYGTLDTPVYFNSDGVQRIRIMQREDGLRIDQIVISAGTYADRAPGTEKNDATIVPAFPSSSRGGVVSHAYRFAGIFPVTLTLSDAGQTATAATSATIR